VGFCLYEKFQPSSRDEKGVKGRQWERVWLLWAILTFIQAKSRTTGLPSLKEICAMAATLEHIVRGHVQ